MIKLDKKEEPDLNDKQKLIHAESGCLVDGFFVPRTRRFDEIIKETKIPVRKFLAGWLYFFIMDSFDDFLVDSSELGGLGDVEVISDKDYPFVFHRSKPGEIINFEPISVPIGCICGGVLCRFYDLFAEEDGPFCKKESYNNDP